MVSADTWTDSFGREVHNTCGLPVTGPPVTRHSYSSLGDLSIAVCRCEGGAA